MHTHTVAISELLESLAIYNSFTIIFTTTITTTTTTSSVIIIITTVMHTYVHTFRVACSDWCSIFMRTRHSLSTVAMQSSGGKSVEGGGSGRGRSEQGGTLGWRMLPCWHHNPTRDQEQHLGCDVVHQHLHSLTPRHTCTRVGQVTYLLTYIGMKNET